MKLNNKNFLCTYLSLLKVKHTQSFTTRHFDEHPYRYTLFGLYKMLAEYHISSVAMRLENHDELHKIKTPFIAHADSEFVIVKDIQKDYFICHWRDHQVRIAPNEFKKMWSGIVLITETNNEAVEPDYSLHRKAEFIEKFPFYCLLLLLIFTYIMGLIVHNTWQTLPFILSFFTVSAGMFVTFLLMLKQLHINSRYAHKACFLFSKHDCNDVLESEGSRLFGVISWSELGIGYFSSNFLLITFFPYLLPYLALINILALPYSFWSIWYQKFKIKQWCSLCLMVQLILWTHFAVNLISGYITLPTWNWKEIVTVLLIYGIPFFLIHLSVPYWNSRKQIDSLQRRAKNLILKNNIFTALLTKNKSHESNSIVLFGNIHANNRISVLTNPHCEPCGKMHKLLEELLDEIENGFCIEYIFSSFGEEFDNSSKFLIAAYLNCDENELKEIYSSWYKGGRYKREEFFARYHFNLEDERVVNEWEAHKSWQKTNKFTATPTILFDGYELPEEYDVTDLKYFIDFDIKNCTERAYVQSSDAQPSKIAY